MALKKERKALKRGNSGKEQSNLKREAQRNGSVKKGNLSLKYLTEYMNYVNPLRVVDSSEFEFLLFLRSTFPSRSSPILNSHHFQIHWLTTDFAVYPFKLEEINNCDRTIRHHKSRLLKTATLKNE